MSRGRTRLAGCAGVTLMELMLAAALLSVVLLAGTSVYVSGMSVLSGQGQNWDQLNTMLAMDYMVKRIRLANDVQIDPGGKWIAVRWDRDLTGAPLPVPCDLDFTDIYTCTWLRIGYMAGTLRSEITAAPGPVTGAATPVDATLNVDTALSAFTLNNPAGPPTMDLDLVTGTGPGQIAVHTGVILRSMGL